jgi:hypothetical protein
LKEYGLILRAGYQQDTGKHLGGFWTVEYYIPRTANRAHTDPRRHPRTHHTLDPHQHRLQPLGYFLVQNVYPILASVRISPHSSHPSPSPSCSCSFPHPFFRWTKKQPASPPSSSRPCTRGWRLALKCCFSAAILSRPLSETRRPQP